MTKHKKPKPMFWITGNYYECQKSWQSISGMLEDPNVVVLDCGYVSDISSYDRYSTASDVILMLKNKEIFDTRPRIIKMKGLPENYKLITDYLHLVNDKNVLVVDSPIGLKAKGSKRFISAAASKFYKTIATEGKVFKSNLVAKNNLSAVQWVQEVAADLGRDVENNAAKFLVELKGRDLDILYSEMSKLFDYQLKKITKKDVRHCCSPLFVQTTWDLLDQLNTQQFDNAIAYLQEFYENAGKETGQSFYGDVTMLTASLYKHFRFIMHAKDTCGETPNRKKIEEVVGSFKKRRKKGDVYLWDQNIFDPKFLSININKPSFRIALQWPKKKIYETVLQVSRCREICRKANRKEVIKLALDTLIMRICGKISFRQASKILEN